MGGDHHHPTFKVPDYTIYKVEDVPKLMMVKKALAAKGLKDPWLRNEVWRYNEKEFGSKASRIYITFFRGFKFGATAFVLTVIGTTLYKKLYGKDDHDHGHH